VKTRRPIETPMTIEAQTVRFWTQRTGHECSHEEARQMVENVAGFLPYWQHGIARAERNSNSGKSVAMSTQSKAPGGSVAADPRASQDVGTGLQHPFETRRYCHAL